MIEIFKHANYDFLGKKWIFIGLSWLLILAGVVSVAWRALDGNPNTHPFNMGVDFSGGTLVDVKFRDRTDLNKLRLAIEQQGVPGPQIQLQPVAEGIGQGARNEVLIRLPNLLNVERKAGESVTSAKATTDADIGKQKILAALQSMFSAGNVPGKTDINTVGRDQLKDQLAELDPLGLRAGGTTQTAETRYREIAGRIMDYREKERGGLVGSIDEIKNLSGIEPQLGQGLTQIFYAGQAAIKSAEAVSPQVGADLRNRAIYVTLLACAGMLAFVAYRFRSLGFGIGAIVAVVHDVLITLGIFSIMHWEINLTVIAALLTLVGYSMNDTIVIFDRIREMMRVRRRDKLELLANEAINQTLSRTIIAAGLTFLTVLSLLLFGGEVLKSFSWALFIGIIIGTYSSIYIASPFMLWWEGLRKQPMLASVGSAPAGRSAAPAAGAGAPVSSGGSSGSSSGPRVVVQPVAGSRAGGPRSGKGKKKKSRATAPGVTKA
jgi:preprotein translocase subunit SecF